MAALVILVITIAVFLGTLTRTPVTTGWRHILLQELDPWSLRLCWGSPSVLGW